MRNRSVHKSMIISKVIYVEKPISKSIYFKCNEQKVTTKLIRTPLIYILIKMVKSTLNLKSPYII